MNKAVRGGAFLIGGMAYLLSAASAHAQSSVTLYGTLDTGILYTSKTPNAAGQNAGSTVSFENAGLSPTNFGIKGTEDLGGGYAAKFDLQSGIDLGTGGFDNNLAGSFFGRQSWLGLSSPYGEVRFGVQFSPFEDAMYELDPREFSQLGSLITLYSANIVTGTFSQNALEYRSPNIRGLTVRLMTNLGGHAGNFREGFGYSGMLMYEIGGFKFVAGAMDQVEASGTPETNAAFIFSMPVVAKTLGLSYTFSTVRVAASYTTFRAPELLGNALNGANDIYSLGADWSITPAFGTNAAVSYIRDPDISGSHAFQVAGGLNYLLSKRTTLYGQVAVVNNSGGEHIGPTMENGNLIGVTGTTVAANIGIKHTF